MTKIIKRKLFCNKCNKYYDVDVVMSVNSYLLEKSPELKAKKEAGTLFKNFCPKCGEELVNKDYE